MVMMVEIIMVKVVTMVVMVELIMVKVVKIIWDRMWGC